MRRKRLDWLFWGGVVYLVLLGLLAVVGPNLRHSPVEPAHYGYDAGFRGERSGDGVLVTYVKRGSSAYLAGIRAQDTVVMGGGDAVRGERGASFEAKVRKMDGTTQTVRLVRDQEVRAEPFLPPSRDFWLGTDEQGRDVFARLAYGARMSLFIGFAVQAIALVVGVVMGSLGVFAPKWISVPVLRLTDGMFAFPDILLAILIVGIWNKRFEAMIVALAITAWPAVARLVRTQVATLKDREYVVASKALGAGTVYLVMKHILPHLWGIVLAVAMIDVAGVILAESALSFLGIGIQAPTPSWGAMIEMGRANMNSYPVMLLWPCLALSLTVFALNFVGDGLRALADPRSE